VPVTLVNIGPNSIVQFNIDKF